MKKLLKSVKVFIQDETGATAIEYGLIIGLIAVGIVASVGFVRDALVSKFDEVCSTLGGSCGAVVEGD